MSFEEKELEMSVILNKVAKSQYGITITAAHADSICADCKYRVADRLGERAIIEYGITALGPCCFPKGDYISYK